MMSDLVGPTRKRMSQAEEVSATGVTSERRKHDRQLFGRHCYTGSTCKRSFYIHRQTWWVCWNM